MLSVRNSLMNSRFYTGNTIPGRGCAFNKPWQNSNSKITRQENEKLETDQALKSVYNVFILYGEDKTRDFLPTFIVVASGYFSVLFNPANFLLLIHYFC